MRMSYVLFIYNKVMMVGIVMRETFLVWLL
jgi:hypothetical protein